MKTILFFLTYLLFSFAQANASELADSFSIEFGDADDGVDIYRVAIQKDFSEWLEHKNIPVEGFFETSLSYWKGSEDDLFSISFAPVLRTKLCKECNFKRYAEAGLGIAVLSEEEIDDINMSSHFQFESRIGVGVKTHNVDAHIRLMHYSNGGLKDPNEGIDILYLGFEYTFLDLKKDMQKTIK